MVIKLYNLRVYDLTGYTVTMTHSSGTAITKPVTDMIQTIPFEITKAGTWTITNSKNEMTKEVIFNKEEGSYNPPAIYYWDFTQSLTDTMQNVDAVLTSATRDENGVYISSSSGYIKIPVQVSENQKISVEFGTMTKGFGTSHGRLFMLDSASGLISRNGGNFSVYGSNSSWDSGSNLAYDAFTNAKLTVETYKSGNNIYWKIYKDDVLVYSPSVPCNFPNNYFMIGSEGGQGYYSMYVKKLWIDELA